MLALVATLLIAVYILGPDLLSRWILDFVVPTKSLVQTKSEEVTRGVVWAIIPLFIAWISRRTGPFSVAWNSKFDVQMFFSGIYSEAFFQAHRAEFFTATIAFLRLNVCIIVRLYAIVIMASLVINQILGNYGKIRHWVLKKDQGWILTIFSLFILPRVSEWHVLLSPMLLPSRKMNIAVDVMTKSNALYQGKVNDKVISSDGGLHAITLADAQRFRRDQYLKDIEGLKAANDLKDKTGLQDTRTASVSPENYWKPIPGKFFVLLGTDISTLNVRHIPSTVEPFRIKYDDVADAISKVAKIFRDLEKHE